jgi:hypothetical protein
MQTIFDYAVIGVGAAGLSFLKERHQLINKKFIAIDKNIHTQKNHIFGFWNMPWTKELTRHSHKHWNAWSIISQDEEISFYSEKHKYEILYLDKWKNESLKSERDLVICQNNVRTIHKKNKIFEITLDNALIESTMFSFNEENDEWYIKAIENYLYKFYNLNEWTVLDEEKGSIPMTVIDEPKNDFINIGTMSGAMKPSSGYAMSFIQKQISDLFQNDSIINRNITNPHKKIDLWMDKVFLKVLEADSIMAIDIFIKLGKILNGDEFALFMSGRANMLIRLKIIFKMPKKPFLKALFH